MQIQRLNMDSSWWLQWQENQWLIDPWLIGSEVDGFRWLNEQWHATEPVALDRIPKADFILVSQSYEDHCHPQTLEKLDEKLPIIASPKAFRKLKKAFPKRNIQEIPLLVKNEKPLTINNLHFFCLRPKKILDPIYYGVLMYDAENQAIFYAPHGFFPRPEEIQWLKNYTYKLLITTFSYFKIPEFMGGEVNPGLENARMLASLLQPQHILNTHDEAKIMKGLVAQLAQAIYPDLGKIQKEELDKLILSPDYQKITL